MTTTQHYTNPLNAPPISQICGMGTLFYLIGLLASTNSNSSLQQILSKKNAPQLQAVEGH